ncbi:MAG: TetR/AcrR family transcriptional regulator [Cyclobacteriaceae bacterium]|nr:TetR/AcrR family transcriptional regulator [Cyclobacteriaceae bacterium]
MEQLLEPKINTRDFIIAKAAELFNLHGYNGCSMSDIMKATHLKKGGIYNYFKSKDEIAVEAFNYSYKKIIERFRSKLDYDKSSVEKLFSIIEVYASFISKPLMKGGCPIFNTAVDATDNHPALKERAKKGIDSLQKYIEIKVEEGIECGEFKTNCEPSKIASLMIINLEGAIIMSRVHGNDEHMLLTVELLKDYINKCRT